MSDDNTSRGTFVNGRRSKDKDLFGSIASKEIYEESGGKNNFEYKRITRKNKSVFDEYEQRGDVLEGYEDLNSSRTDDSNDPVLS